MKMHAMMSFDYPDDEDKLRRAINADQMYETLVDLKIRIEEGWKDDDDPGGVIMVLLDKINHAIKLVGEQDA